MEKDCNCNLETCDMFDFMSKHVGLNVLHPGGIKATYDLLEKLQIKGTDKVLDIACGKGINSVLIAKKYGCKVVGIDILEESINMARTFAKKMGVQDLVAFQTADALNLPFNNAEFDVTVAQAMLILVADKEKVIKEAKRVAKAGGKSGWLELSWKDAVTDDFIQYAKKELCGLCIGNVETFENWTKLFKALDYKNLTVDRYTMSYRGMVGMIEDEGLTNGLRVMFKYCTNANIRKRMRNLDKFFRNSTDYVGYGIYIGINNFT